MSTQNYRSNQFSGKNFKQWRQTKPTVNYATLETQDNLDPMDQAFVEGREDDIFELVN